jgi:hypothetical protein
MTTDAAKRAALRLRQEFKKARAGGYYDNGWYSYMDKADIEALVLGVLGPEAIEPVRVQVLNKSGEVIFDTDAGWYPEQEYEAVQVYTTGVGQVITNVHSEADCEGRACTIHRPSDHHMRSWSTNWRDGGMFDIKGPHMERICPHGIGHPDPDDLEFHLSRGQDYSVHGCDGCCIPGGYERFHGAAGAQS